MKRALLVIVIAVFTAPVGTWHPVVEAAPAVAALPTETLPEKSTTTGGTPDSSGCAVPNGSALAAARGCCQQHGGVCGCRDGSPKCCDGTIGADCSCRANTPPSETDVQGGR